MKNATDILTWLTDHPLINIRGLEREAGIPENVLKNAMRGLQALADKHARPLMKVLEKYGYDN